MSRSASRTAIAFLQRRWPEIPPRQLELIYLSGRLVEETARAADGEGGEERLEAMLAAVWRDEADLGEPGLFEDDDAVDAPIPFFVVEQASRP